MAQYNVRILSSNSIALFLLYLRWCIVCVRVCMCVYVCVCKSQAGDVE